MMWDWNPWWHWLPMMGVWLVFIGAIVWAVVRVFPTGRSPGARELLDERLARGDIDVEQYRRLRDELVSRS